MWCEYPNIFINQLFADLIDEIIISFLSDGYHICDKRYHSALSQNQPAPVGQVSFCTGCTQKYFI